MTIVTNINVLTSV